MRSFANYLWFVLAFTCVFAWAINSHANDPFPGKCTQVFYKIYSTGTLGVQVADFILNSDGTLGRGSFSGTQVKAYWNVRIQYTYWDTSQPAGANWNIVSAYSESNYWLDATMFARLRSVGKEVSDFTNSIRNYLVPKCPSNCPASGQVTYHLFDSDLTSSIGNQFCQDDCQVTIKAVEVYPPVNNKVMSNTKLEFTGIECAEGNPVLPDEAEPPQTEDCKKKKADCTAKCPQGVKKFQCDDADPSSSVCECDKSISCVEEMEHCVAQCNGESNIKTFQCSMVAGAPVVSLPCTCEVPPAPKSCQDYLDAINRKCGVGNVESFDCRTLPNNGGTVVFDPGSCKKDVSCSPGRICANDGVCQDGEDPNSLDCRKPTTPIVIENPDGTTTPGETENTNTTIGPGEAAGHAVARCPPGQICANDGVCQPGESLKSPDCESAATDGGKANPSDNSTGQCPAGSVCLGDGVCQQGESQFSPDCAGSAYAATRIQQMNDVVKTSPIFHLTDNFKIPSGGNSVFSTDFGNLGGVQTLDLASFSSIWQVLKLLFTVIACWVGVRIITLKR